MTSLVGWCLSGKLAVGYKLFKAKTTCTGGENAANKHWPNNFGKSLQECAKLCARSPYFSYVARSDRNCGCNGASCADSGKQVENNLVDVYVNVFATTTSAPSTAKPTTTALVTTKDTTTTAGTAGGSFSGHSIRSHSLAFY